MVTHMFYGTCHVLFQKWMKKDAYLFVPEIPVLCLCPRGTDLSSSSCETIHLDDIDFISNMSKTFKNNVLAIAFSSCNLLLAFDSKCRRNLWFSEIVIMCLTGTFSHLMFTVFIFMYAEYVAIYSIHVLYEI